jgi:hypothetical protein
MAAWPASLPQQPSNFADFTQTYQDPLVRTQMDEGEPKVRRRFTKNILIAQYTMLMTTAQCATLRTFYETTLGHGAAVFTFDEFVYGDTSVNHRFIKPPAFKPASKVMFTVSLAFEIFP